MPDLFFDPTADDQELLAQVVSYYHAALTQTPEALDFLCTHGVTNSQAVERFCLGYSNRTLGKTLPSRDTNLGKSLRHRLEGLGVFREETGHEHFVGCVVFPIRAADRSGRIVDVYGHKIGRGYKSYCKLDLHLGHTCAGVFNIEAFGSSPETILTTSVFDALAFWCNGYRNVTCTFSPDYLSEDHLRAFGAFKVHRVLTLTEAVAGQLMGAGIETFLVRLPVGVDTVAYVQQAKDAADALGSLLRKAEWLGKGKSVEGPTIAAMGAAQREATTVAGSEVSMEPAISKLSRTASTFPGSNGRTDPAIPELPPVRSASPVAAALADVDVEVKDDEVTVIFGDRRYRVRGLAKNLSVDQMRVNVLVVSAAGLFVDTFDLYGSKPRQAFTILAAEEMGVEPAVIKKDLGRLLLLLEQLQDQRIAEELQPKDATPTMTEAEHTEAMHLLRDPHLLDRIGADITLVGEATNKLVGYLAAVSRKLDQPLAVVIQSTSAAGKTALMNAVLSLVPPEDLVKFSAMTGQSLYYMGEGNLKHKILAIVEEGGAERASYALKLLQSEGELRIASTGKDNGTGRLTTHEYRVEGPVSLFLTTNSTSIDEELLNRCLILTVDEGREQTQAIHQAQRRRQTVAGILDHPNLEKTLALHRNAQRLLRPLLVANPYAEKLTFLDDKIRMRRDHLKYLTLIRAITLLHQYQRPIRTIEHHGRMIEYIEVAEEDIDVANKLITVVLTRCLDELPPQTRRLLLLIDAMVSSVCRDKGIDRADYRFSRREVREYSGWGHSQVAVHLTRLEAMEYLLVHRGRNGKSYLYELAYVPPRDELPLLTRLFGVLNTQRNGHLPAIEG